MALADGWPVPIPRRATPFPDEWVEQRVVWVRGEHDVSTVAALSETLARAIALDHAELVMDLSGVEFMGVATVRVIKRTREFLRGRSRSLVLRSPSKPARLVLGLCGFGDLLPPEPVDSRRSDGTALESWVAVPVVDQVGVVELVPVDLVGHEA